MFSVRYKLNFYTSCNTLKRIKLYFISELPFAPVSSLSLHVFRFSSNVGVINKTGKNTQISNFTKILSVGAEFFMRTDGETDTTNLIVAFRRFAKAAKT